ncbi:MAG: hypothetical protein SFH39_01135 [Candidatus Magnetobacterium sp. LHC-1]|uniref:Uncharacterized protein n=1 Tax=Candidatus Magnetobacterium casense TaxID=1455061 RepID=A0ABS6RVI9_9BACT|nr:hypothetical protein [Candidatus Magnetobacterium casensis]MBF0607123.1 hypothetical protein [Nitrospirota bacterium]MBV6340029.1 hypothetical protein [Candidatus Magnetobacterium casensis]
MPKKSIIKDGEGIWYLENARAILKNADTEDHIYLDVKLVMDAAERFIKKVTGSQ